MLYFSKWKIAAICLTLLAAFVFAMPNFFSKSFVDSWPDWLPKKQLSLGLDLRGVEGPFPRLRAVVEINVAARRVDDEDAPAPRGRNEFVHVRSHLRNAVGRNLAAHGIPHIADDDGRFLRIPFDRLVDDAVLDG